MVTAAALALWAFFSRTLHHADGTVMTVVLAELRAGIHNGSCPICFTYGPLAAVCLRDRC